MCGIQRPPLPQAWRRTPKSKATSTKLDTVPCWPRCSFPATRLGDELGESPSRSGARRAWGTPSGLKQSLYTADGRFQCFADLALASPANYRSRGQDPFGLQCVPHAGIPGFPQETRKSSATLMPRCGSLYSLGEGTLHLDLEAT